MILGHQKQLDFLKKTFKEGKLSHAFIFIGPAQIGKKTVALEFLKFINCQNKNLSERPCNSCFFCQAIQKRNFADLMIIGEQEGTILIDEVKLIKDFLSKKPFYEGCYKSVIIDNAHNLTMPAQNAFLKFLEEPRGDTIIILITSFYHLLLKTIISRCQKIYFNFVSEEILKDFLETQKIDQKKKERILFYSFQKPAKLINFLKNLSLLEKEEAIIKNLFSFFEKDLWESFFYLKDLKNKKINYNNLIEIIIDYLRKKLISGEFESGNLKLLEEISRLQFQLSFSNINQRLAMEMLFLNFNKYVQRNN